MSCVNWQILAAVTMINLDQNSLNELARQAKVELARRNYADYVDLVHHGKYRHFRHTRLICEHLQRIVDGEQLHLMIEMPPRSGKSMTVTETYPSYFIGRNPDKRVIASAYSDGLARKFGRLNRNKFAEFGKEIFNKGLSADNSSTSNWGVSGLKGGMIATGIGGSITGEGADLLLIDDPIKNAKEALSTTIRENIWNEWESTLSTRLHDGASVIVVMTRWHEDDLIGRLLERSPYDWIRLRLPAIAEEDDDLIGRKIGEALVPELGFNEEWAAKKMVEVGQRTWTSLYQQRPAPESGAIFKREWISKVDAAPLQYDDILTSWDFSFKGSKESDFVAGQVWLKKGSDFYLIDQVRARYDFTQSVKATQRVQAKHNNCRKILVEDKANGPAIINSLKSKISGIIPVTPRESKEARAYAVTPFFEAGNVHIVKDVPHADEFIEELISFPNGLHDDTVDTCTQALNYFANKKSSNVFSINPW